MSEEKEQRKIEETNSDQASIESGDAIDEKKLLRKLDLHLLPGLTLLYLLSFLDRSNGDPFSLLSCAYLLLIFFQSGMLVSKAWSRICT